MQQIIEFSGNHTILVSAFIVVAIMLISTEISRLTRGFDEVSPAQATRLMSHEAALLLDIRPANENREGHIPGSRHIPTKELASRLTELEKYKQSHVITYCRSGNRSVAACNILKSQGFENVHSLSGGMLAWQTANLPITKN